MPLDALNAGRLPSGHVLAWAIVLVFATVVAMRAYRRARTLGASAATLLFALVVPWLSLGLTGVLFLVLRAHPLAQYNDAGTAAASSSWFFAWPLLFLGAFGGCLASAFGVARSCVRELRGSGEPWWAWAWLAMVLANGITLAAVFANFPGA